MVRNFNAENIFYEEGNGRRYDSPLIRYSGKTQSVVAWARDLKMKPSTLHSRIFSLGWSVEKAFSTPTHTQFRSKGKS